MADSRNTKRADDLVPFCADQGIPYLCGAGAAGLSVQIIADFTVSSDPETITFADQGLQDMADANYVIMGQNQTDPADQPNFDQKATGSFQMNGPDAADVVDIVIVGRLKNQLG